MSLDTGQALFSIQGLSKVYATLDGPVRALDHVTLDVRRG